MGLEVASARAYAQDMRPMREQAQVTRTRLIPAIDTILARLAFHRAEVDRVYETRRGQLAPPAPASLSDAPSFATYPIGFCREIRDEVWQRACADPEFQKLIGPGIVLRKVFVLLEGQYFQNAVQLGNLFVDVANDTVWTSHPKLEWKPVEEVDYENVDSWRSFAAVGRRYLKIELYPNLLFPFAFPAAPFFAIRPSGRIDLFFAQDTIFLKDLGDAMRRTRQLLADQDLMSRRLPPAYEVLLRQACGGNLLAAFPLEFAPSSPAGIRDGVVAEFAGLAQQPPERALAQIKQYLNLIATSARRLMHLNLVPSAETLARLRAEGAIPPPDSAQTP